MAEATGGVVEGTLPFKPGQRLNPNEVDSSAPTEQPGEQTEGQTDAKVQPDGWVIDLNPWQKGEHHGQD